jgi:hypothetical protein
MVNSDGHPNLSHARSDPAPSVPPRLGLFANQLEFAAPGYVRRENYRYFTPEGPGKAASSV